MDFQVRRSWRRSRAAHKQATDPVHNIENSELLEPASFSRRPHAPELRDVCPSLPLFFVPVPLRLSLSLSRARTHIHTLSLSRLMLSPEVTFVHKICTARYM